MATLGSMAIRRDEAYARIVAATKKLAKGVDASPSAVTDIRHRDPVEEQLMRLEEVADTLEALAKAHSGAAKDGTDAPATKEEAEQRVETELEAETGKDFVETSKQPPTLAESDAPARAPKVPRK